MYRITDEQEYIGIGCVHCKLATYSHDHHYTPSQVCSPHSVFNAQTPLFRFVEDLLCVDLLYDRSSHSLSRICHRSPQHVIHSVGRHC